ncbi:Imm50 family immunity protein [Streptomyces sp. NPDC053493]|uniref:Imm50 family immunity protein n=1 Tax=Streptomyces sp. NPDC053493 TaxID=3365705 RepID=UPI0037D6BFD2
MNASDWTSLVDPENVLSRLYDTPPALDDCVLLCVQIDERGCSVTMGFETFRVPTTPPAAWDRPYNTLEFSIGFTGVEGLSISGWNSAVREGVRFSAHGSESVRVSLHHVDSRLAFTATGASVTRLHPYLAGKP